MCAVRVRRLHLRATGGAAAAAGRRFLTDALDGASVDDGSRRLLLVRKLASRPIRAGGSSLAATRWFEGAVRDLAAAAVHGERDEAATAAAVWFASELEACLAAARRIASGGRCEAWFWPLAIDGLRSALAPEQALRVVIRRALDQEPAMLASAAVVGALDAEAATAPLIAALTADDAVRYLTRCGWAAPRGVAAPAPSPATSPIGTVLANSPLLVLATAHWGKQDARTLWLGASIVLARMPQLAADRALQLAVHEALHGAEKVARLPPGFTPHGQAYEGSPARMRIAAAPPMLIGTSRPYPPAGVTVPYVDAPIGYRPVPAALRSVDSAASLSIEAPDACPEPPEFQNTYESDTEHAGVLFLLNPLQRLGFERRLAARPELLADGLPASLFAALARHLAIAEKDPILPAWLAADAPLDALASAWVAALRHWCRRHACMTLRQIARRPGRIARTPTHIDVFLAAGAIDIRLRRSGLDLNPGWVPWFGRVVTFHYEACDEVA